MGSGAFNAVWPLTRILYGRVVNTVYHVSSSSLLDSCILSLFKDVFYVNTVLHRTFFEPIKERQREVPEAHSEVIDNRLFC